MSYILNPLFYFTEATGIGSNSNQAQHVGLTGTMDFEASVHIATTTFVSVGGRNIWGVNLPTARQNGNWQYGRIWQNCFMQFYDSPEFV